jgi:hypothetical protein
VFEPEMPRWIAQELREKRQAIASASRGAAAVQVLAQVTQDRPCRSCAAKTAGLPLAGIDGEAVCLNTQSTAGLRSCVLRKENANVYGKLHGVRFCSHSDTTCGCNLRFSLHRQR